MSLKKFFGCDCSEKEKNVTVTFQQDQEYMQLLDENVREIRRTQVYLSCILAIAILILIYLIKMNRSNG